MSTSKYKDIAGQSASEKVEVDFSDEHEPDQIGGGRVEEPKITWEEAYTALLVIIC